MSTSIGDKLEDCMRFTTILSLMIVVVLSSLVWYDGDVIARQQELLVALQNENARMRQENELMLQELQALGLDGVFTQAEAEYFCDFVGTFRE
jgi:hypothetical protein